MGLQGPIHQCSSGTLMLTVMIAIKSVHIRKIIHYPPLQRTNPKFHFLKRVQIQVPVSRFNWLFWWWSINLLNWSLQIWLVIYVRAQDSSEPERLHLALLKKLIYVGELSLLWFLSVTLSFLKRPYTSGSENKLRKTSLAIPLTLWGT